MCRIKSKTGSIFDITMYSCGISRPVNTFGSFCFSSSCALKQFESADRGASAGGVAVPLFTLLMQGCVFNAFSSWPLLRLPGSRKWILPLRFSFILLSPERLKQDSVFFVLFLSHLNGYLLLHWTAKCKQLAILSVIDQLIILATTITLLRYTMFIK